ncbi:hypothetical protein L195_g037328 [Trifolium pratense]|uniref:Secreted protein n=1 Tax=Trifolium pratense TaxID=57577 RepID=A0A2K3LRZ5_TRIPR|nr:hypothetical protein L195_g037328 [Trifolium pratense]
MLFHLIFSSFLSLFHVTLLSSVPHFHAAAAAAAATPAVSLEFTTDTAASITSPSPFALSHARVLSSWFTPVTDLHHRHSKRSDLNLLTLSSFVVFHLHHNVSLLRFRHP